MPQLSDSQLVVLTAACQRPDRCVFPVTARLKGNAAGNVLKSLINKGLIKELRAKRDDTVWRHDEERGRMTPRSPLLRHAYFVARSQTPRNCCVRFVAGVTVGSRNTCYRPARYGLTRTGLAPVGLHQLLLAPSEIQARRRNRRRK